MEPVRSQLSSLSRPLRTLRGGRLLGTLFVGFCLWTSVGCWFTTKQTTISKLDPPGGQTPPPQKPYIPKPGQAAKIVTMWENQIVHASNTLKGGTTFPGLRGRMLIFGPDVAHPILKEGDLIIDMYDATANGDAEPKMIHQMRIDRETLKQWVAANTIGKGYELFLDWPSYRENVSRISLTVRFDPAEGTPPLFHQTGIFTVDHRSTLEMKAKGQNPTRQPDIDPSQFQPKKPDAVLPQPTPIPILPQ